jgi:hypothetical protein
MDTQEHLTMATLTSKPATLLVRTPAPVQTQFGNGSQTGSFANGVWTPGRDANGVVNAVSWDLVPKRQGVTVAGTQLVSVRAAVEAAVPGWRDYGVEGWNGVTDAWNGFTIDTAGSRLWLMAAGGHAASSNNGIYRFDAFRMAWSVEKMPSDPAPWSESYKQTGRNGNSFTGCQESHDAMLAKKAAGTLSPQNDYFFDELFWDNRPTSRHLYSASAYIPESNELIMSTRRLWRYSLTAGEWTLRRQLNDGAQQFGGSGTWAIYDEVAGEYLHGGAGDALYSTVGYKLSTNSWMPWGAPWAIYGGLSDARHGRQVAMIESPVKVGGPYASVGRYWLYDLDRRAVVSNGIMQFEPGLSREDFPPENWYYGGAGACYVPPLDRYWLCTSLGNGTMPILEVDPSTTPWTVRRQNLAGVVPRSHPNLCRRLVYLPGLNAVLMGDNANKDFWLYRL